MPPMDPTTINLVPHPSLSPNASTTNIDHGQTNTTLTAIVISLSAVVVILIGAIVWLRRKKLRSLFRRKSPEDVSNSGDKIRKAELTPFDVAKNEFSDSKGGTFSAVNFEEITPVVGNKELSHLDVKYTDMFNCEREQSSVTNEPEQFESDLHTLFKMLIDVLGTTGCVKLFINLDPGGNIGDIVTHCTPENCFQFFTDWTSKHSNINHGETLMKTLSRIGYNLPPDNQYSDSDASQCDDGVMISRLLVSLTKSRLLNEELREFCSKLAGRLGVTQMWQISESLHLRAEMERRARGDSLDAAFAEALVEWGLRSPHPHGEVSERDLLMLLKSSMVEACGCDAIALFDETAGSLLEILGNYYSSPQDQP